MTRATAIDRTRLTWEWFAYIPYSLRDMQTRRFAGLMDRSVAQSGLRRAALYRRIAAAWWHHDTLPSDYLMLSMWDDDQRRLGDYVSTLELYRFQRYMNTPAARHTLRNKLAFRAAFADLVPSAGIDTAAATPAQILTWFDTHRPTRIAVKDPCGQGGLQVEVVDVDATADGWAIGGVPVTDYLRHARRHGRTLVEQGITQHPTIRELHPDSVNTVRVMTRLAPDDTCHIIAAFLRIGAGGRRDNLTGGGLSAAVDVHTGIVVGQLLDRGPGPAHGEVHPTTGARITGLTIPFWPEALAMLDIAAHRIPNARTVGWDVVITPDGPRILEGNHNWEKTHWQRSEGRPCGAELRAWMADEPPRDGRRRAFTPQRQGRA